MIMFDLLFLTRYTQEVSESLLFLLINSFIIYLSLAFPHLLSSRTGPYR